MIIVNRSLLHESKWERWVYIWAFTQFKLRNFATQMYTPNLRKLLTIFATLPVTTASSERSFSAMRRLRTYLRSTMGEQRLTSLALLSVLRDRPVDKDSVLNEYSVSSNGRSDFLL